MIASDRHDAGADMNGAVGMRKSLMVPAALAGLMIVGVAGTAFAAGPGAIDPEAAAVASLKVSLTQAIAIAEQHTGGKAYDAGVDVDHGKNQIVVETNGPRGVQTVMIDAKTGKIVGEHQGGEQD